MDLSSFSFLNAQQQQAQQQNQNFFSQSYDPTQIQSHDQSYYSYYQQEGEYQEQYAYYQQPDCSPAYQSIPQQPCPETGTSNAPVVLANEGAQISDAGGGQQVQQQQSTYYTGLNQAAAAAVAALSELAHFAGTMPAAERVMVGYNPVVGPGQMRSRVGRRGGRPFQGGGRDNFGHRNPNSVTSGRSFRRRGRGRGRDGRKSFVECSGLSTSSNTESCASEGAELVHERADPSTDALEKAAQLLAEPSLSATEPGKVEPSQRPPKAAWCELCRVNCTSLLILEQHKNGKRHRKNLLIIEELRKAVKSIAEMQNEQNPIAESKIEVSQQPESVQDGEEIEAAVDVPTESVSDEKEMQAEHQNNADEQPEVSMTQSSDLQAGKPKMYQFNYWRHGMKRKIRSGQGGKRMKMFEGQRQPTEPPKPKVVIPLICNLCNVKCDTPEVFDRHLSGKKHIAKLKRFEGHQAMYGPQGVQALYPPNPLAQTLYQPQNHHQQTFNGSQGLNPPPGAYMPAQTYKAAATAASVHPQFLQYPVAQSETTIEYGGQNAVIMA